MNKFQKLALAWLSTLTLNTAVVANTSSTFNIEEFKNKVATDIALRICKKYDIDNINDVKLDLEKPFNVSEKNINNPYVFPEAYTSWIYKVDIKMGNYDFEPRDVVNNNNKKEQFKLFWIENNDYFINLANESGNDINNILRKKLENNDWCQAIYKEARELGLIENKEVEK